ncbi:hypothetical protein LXL04_019533 [Taraxacum kok-saghyz]
MADQHSNKDAGKANTVTESSDKIDHRSDEHLGTNNVPIENAEPKNVSNQHPDKALSTTNVSVKSPESSGVANQHSDKGASIADVVLESVKSKADKHPDHEGATTSNVTVEKDDSTVEINVKTLDSQLHNFNVNKNMPVSLFKKKIAGEVGLAVEHQRLIFRGKVLKDEDLLSEYHVESGHTLHLVSRHPSELQVSSSSPDADTSTTHRNTDGNEGGSSDITQVIGAVLNSFGIGGQTPIGGSQPNMQFSIPVQVAQANETIPSPSQPPAPVPTLATPIPDSLNTISEFLNHMEQALSQNGYEPSNITTELPCNTHGPPSPAALAVVIRQAHRLLSGPALHSLSHTASRLEEEEGTSDVTVRTQIQSEAMQSGLAMQHLGALLLELGRTMLTLRIGQSHAESCVNAGPAVYISPSGPNPIMVQPFPLQTNSLFDGHTNPIGIGGIPRHLNIHIHTGPRPTYVESNQTNVTLPAEVRTYDNIEQDARGSGNVASSSTRMKSVNEAEGASSSSGTPGNASSVPVGLGSRGLQSKRRQWPTRSELGGQRDPSTTMNQITQDPALSGFLSGLSNQNGNTGSQDFFRNLMTQVAQNPAMMNTVNQLAQQMDGNQDLAGMLNGSSGGHGGNLDISSMVQQMMPFVSQTLNRGSSGSNSLQSTPPRKGGAVNRRYSSVKSVNTNKRSTDFQMNLEHVAQKIVDQYPPLEIFSSVVETASGLYNNASDTGPLDELCSEEELAQEFMEMLKRDVSRRLQGDRR